MERDLGRMSFGHWKSMQKLKLEREIHRNASFVNPAAHCPYCFVNITFCVIKCSLKSTEYELRNVNFETAWANFNPTLLPYSWEILLLWEQLHCPSSQGTCVSFSEQKYLMSSDQLFNILLSLLFNGIALSLIYYQPLLHTAPKTQITCFLISSLLSDWSISRILVQHLGDEGHVIPSTCMRLLTCKAAVTGNTQEISSTFHWLPLKIEAVG